LPTIHPLLANLNKYTPDSHIIEVINSILSCRNDIREVTRFRPLEDGKSRNFLIDTFEFSSANKVIELFGGVSSDCKAFAITGVILKIYD
jgi:hypothetical protein